MSDLPKRRQGGGRDHADAELALQRVRDAIPDAAYTPAASASWGGSDPATLREAVDRLAAYITSIHVPVP